MSKKKVIGLKQGHTSEMIGFRNSSPSKRIESLREKTHLSNQDLSSLSNKTSLPEAVCNGMVENVIGSFEIPLGIATNFQINGKDYLIPMVVEEPSVIAAASHMAKIVRRSGGFRTTSTEPLMRAQIQLLDVQDPEIAKLQLLKSKPEIISLANSQDKILVELGGGCVSIEVQTFLKTIVGPMLVLHLVVNVLDAMGANTVNSMAEAVAPLLEKLTGGRTKLKILSNLADLRLAKAEINLPLSNLAFNNFSGEDVAKGIIEAYALATVDPYRAATHNKGIMNGIDPIVLATGNDWRAIEAGAHAWATRKGSYTSLSKWQIKEGKFLHGSLEMPLAVGIVGGATKTHPTSKACIKLLGVKSATELSEILVATGLAQNMGALRALATEGIQKGHMALHSRNIAIAAGAEGSNIDLTSKHIVKEGNITVQQAILFLKNNVKETS